MSDQILQSWEENASNWIEIIANAAIHSRNFTSPAILNQIKALKPTLVLDVGCGEGWLCRELTANQIHTVGIDFSPTLIDYATSRGSEEYYVVDYFNLNSQRQLQDRNFDCAVFNFCIFEQNGVDQILHNIYRLLKPNGAILIQTLPFFESTLSSTEPQNQWQPNAWEGLPEQFTNGHSFYARTKQDWIQLAQSAQLSISNITQVKNDKTEVVSVILKLKK